MLLTIGYHQLEGKRLELKKPFVVMDREQGADGESTHYKVGEALVLRAKELTWGEISPAASALRLLHGIRASGGAWHTCLLQAQPAPAQTWHCR